jgi:hypothetical protein
MSTAPLVTVGVRGAVEMQIVFVFVIFTLFIRLSDPSLAVHLFLIRRYRGAFPLAKK